MLLVSFRKSRSLHLLAKFRDIHGFIALDTLHFLEEELSRTGSFHIAGYILVEYRALLKDTDAVMVGSDAIMLVLHRFGNFLVS